MRMIAKRLGGVEEFINSRKNRKWCVEGNLVLERLVDFSDH